MSRWANKYVIGLTGNIAVGKSVVRQMLQHLGAYTIDADGLSHQAMSPGAPAYQPVVEMFGRFLLDSEGRINRQVLGHIVFTYPDALTKLETLVHPVVMQATNTLVTRAKQRVIVIEAIKLIETDLANAVDEIWVVDAPQDVQLKRLLEKRGMTEDEARRRVAVQRPQVEKLNKAHRIIHNGGSVDEAWKEVQTGWTDIASKIRTTGEAAAVPAVPATPAAAAPAQPAAAQPPAQAQPVQAAVPAPAAPVVPGTNTTQVAAATAAPAAVGEAISVNVRRGMPGNAEAIAKFITTSGGKNVDRMDVMMAFGQKSYLLAQDAAEQVVAVMGWQVENLITRADEFYIREGIQQEGVVAALVNAVEEASKELQSEVSYILLSAETPPQTVQSFVNNGYEVTSLEQIRVPAWREAVHELVAANPRILTKKLRADRIMKPI